MAVGFDRAGSTSPAAHSRSLTVLILTAAVGGGHEAAGRALAAELRQAGHWPVVVDGVRAVSGALDTISRGGYAFQLDHAPTLMRGVFWSFTRRPVAGVTHAFAGLRWGRGLRTLAAAYQADLVVSTYTVINGALGWLRSHGRLPIPAVALIPDFGVHPMWTDPGLDLHLVASRCSADLAAAAGARAVPVRLPVAPGFAAPLSRAEARARLGLPPDAFSALITGGSWGIGDLGAYARHALAAGAQPIVVTGHNDRLGQRLRAELADAPGAVVLGWTDQMPFLMRAADCLIHNAGGMTCTEAIAVGLPIVLFDPIPGHGERNARVMVKAGAARLARTPEELRALLAAAVQGEAALPPPARPSAPSATRVLESLAIPELQPERVPEPRPLTTGAAEADA